MARASIVGLVLGLALATSAGVLAGEREERGGRPQAEARPAEQHPGPKGYQRVTEPQGWNVRPKTADRTSYHHNYQAQRAYKVGPYHPPAGWAAHRWTYGEILPRAYWAPEYVLGDYWLFGLDVPPEGAEWVRDGADAILVDTATGEVLQTDYGAFT